MSCEQGLSLATIETLINLNKFEEQIKNKLEDELKIFNSRTLGKISVINHITYYYNTNVYHFLAEEELKAPDWDKHATNLMDLKTDDTSCGEILRHEITRTKDNIDFILKLVHNIN